MTKRRKRAVKKCRALLTEMHKRSVNKEESRKLASYRINDNLVIPECGYKKMWEDMKPARDIYGM